MDTLTLHPGMLATTSASEGIRLLGLPAEKSARKELSGSEDEVVKTIASLLDQMVMQVISKRTAREFEETKKEVFPKYVQLVLSLAGIVTAIVPRSTLMRLTSESFSELEADIREHALPAFGADMRDRAMFTVWTLRKIADLLPIISEGAVAEADGPKEIEFFNAFLIYALSARFGIDCLRASMKSGRAIYPDVLPALNNTLRAAVNAYAWIRQAVDLRSDSANDDIAPPTWDDEDDQLVRESMFDLSHEQA